MIFGKRLKICLSLALIILLHLILLEKTQFTLWPEMVVYPYLLNNNFLLYKDIINPYPPFLTVALSIVTRFFGYTPSKFHLLTLFIIILINLLIFFTSYKIFKNLKSAIASLLIFVIFSIPFGVNGLWFDLVQTPLIILAFYNFYLFLKREKHYNLALSYTFLTVAYFIKQQVIWLAIWFFLVLIFRKLLTKKVIAKALFPPAILVLVIFALNLLYYYKLQSLNDFLFWTITFPYVKASSMPGYVLLPTFRQIIVVAALFLFFLPSIFSHPFKKFTFITAIVLLAFSYPRFDYFHMIPALSLLSLSLAPNIGKYLAPLKTCLAIAVIVLAVFSIHSYKNMWGKNTRFFENEIINDTNTLSSITAKTSPIYIQNGPDQLYPLSGRLPIKPWADEFPWYLEINGIQQRIVSSLSQQDVLYNVYSPYDNNGKFSLGSYRPQQIADYLDANTSEIIKFSDGLILKIKN